MALLLGTAAAQVDTQNATAWTNGQWFNGASFVRVPVFSIGSRLTLKRPKKIDRTVDLAGGFVVPAFGEAHNHNIPGADATYLAQGIFYAMIQENVPGARRPKNIDVAFANGAFTAPGGHPSALVERNIANGGMTAEDRDGGFLLPVSSTDDVDRQWSTRVDKQHPDFIKMMLVYSEDRVSQVPRPANSDRHGLDPSLAAYIVKLAHRDKLRVSAHVESAYDFEVAVKAGVDIVAHMPGFWPDAERIAQKGIDIYKITEDAARLAGRQRVTVVTTVGEALRSMANDSSAPRPHPFMEVYRHNFSILAKHGVRIAIGSDQFRSTSVLEAIEIDKAGLMMRAALLRSLSSDAGATIFPQRAPFGLAEGAPADFLVFDSSPLSDFTVVQRPRRKVKDGQLLD
jgi:imidazolonepropionase-like amidohydrolase